MYRCPYGIFRQVGGLGHDVSMPLRDISTGWRVGHDVSMPLRDISTGWRVGHDVSMPLRDIAARLRLATILYIYAYARLNLVEI